MNKSIFYYTLLMIVLFSACKSTSKITTVEIPVVSELNERIKQIQFSQPQFSTANVSKMAMAINLNDRDLNVSATIKMRKDSALDISIQPFMGIEMFKVELSPDSMRVFDKMNKRYYVLDYKYFKTRFGIDVDFYSLQSMISGQLFCIGKKELVIDSLTLSAHENGKYSIGYQNENILQNSHILSNNTIEQVVLKDKDNKYQMQTNYENFAMVNTVNFPQKISMHITNQKSKVSCDFSVQKVEFNSKVIFSPSSQRIYTRSNIDLLLKK